jgi:hypothetical protein
MAMRTYHPEELVLSSSDTAEELALLKQLVLGEEQSSLKLVQEQVLHLEQVVRRQEVRIAAALSQLEERVTARTGATAFAWLEQQAATFEHHEQVGHMLAGPFEAALRVSASQNQEALAHTLAPIIAPGLRGAIASLFRSAIHGLDRLLHACNVPQRLWWRISAARQHVPYADFRAQKSARFTILSLQLMDRRTGALICEVHRNPSSAHADRAAPVDQATPSLPAGETFRHLSKRLTLVARIIGHGGQALRTRAAMHLAHCEDEIFEQSISALTPLQIGRIQLELGQLLQSTADHPPRPWLGMIGAGALLLGGTWAAVWHWQQQRMRHDFVEMLLNAPGFVITRTEITDDKLVIHGLRDPLAPSPESYLRSFSKTFQKAPNARFKFQPFHSIGTEFETQRESATSNLKTP